MGHVGVRPVSWVCLQQTSQVLQEPRPVALRDLHCVPWGKESVASIFAFMAAHSRIPGVCRGRSSGPSPGSADVVLTSLHCCFGVQRTDIHFTVEPSVSSPDRVMAGGQHTP